jgi:hypothetical protein
MSPEGMTPATPAEIASVRGLITQYGLGELWEGVNNLLQRGYTDPDTIFTIISTDTTPEGKRYQDAFYKRFPAIKIQRDENQRRANQGLPPVAELSAAQYISNEQAYIDAVSDTDPALASAANITSWLTGSGTFDRPVSPNEVRGRIDVAREYIYSSVDPRVREELRGIYGLSDQQMLSYVLSDDKQKSQLEAEFQTNMRRANVGAQAASRGLGLSSSLRDEIAAGDAGYTFGDTAAKFGSIERDADTYTKLSAMSGINTSRDDLIREEFELGGGASTTKLKKRLASQERARFSGSSAIGNSSLRAGGIGTQ